MRVIETMVYDFDELSEKAKGEAREWYRDNILRHNNWWHDDTLEEWQGTILPAMGWSGAKIGYRGFRSQGDGAHFEGEWRSANVNRTFMETSGWTDSDIKLFIEAYAALADRYPYAFCRIKHRGHYHYQHENCTEFDVEVLDANGDHDTAERENNFEQAIRELSKKVMRHIYQMLEKEWDWRNKDEQVDEEILALGQTFTEDGEVFS